MSIANVSDVRIIGKLPPSQRLKDELLQPHFEAAVRELKSWIGSYQSSTGEKREACKYAECCITMHNFLLAADTFYTEGMLEYQKTLGEIEFVPNSPDNAEKLMTLWWNRARDAVAAYMTTESGGISRVGFYAV